MCLVSSSASTTIQIALSTDIAGGTHFAPYATLWVMLCLPIQFNLVLSMRIAIQLSTSTVISQYDMRNRGGISSYFPQCCFPAPVFPTILLQEGILHLSLPVSRCQWSRVTISLERLFVSDTKNVSLLFELSVRFWKLFIREGSTHCLGLLVFVNDVCTFFCALRSHESRAPLESSSLCSTSRCYIEYWLVGWTCLLLILLVFTLFRFCKDEHETSHIGQTMPSVGT
jgi:hypothetical protein